MSEQGPLASRHCFLKGVLCIDDDRVMLEWLKQILSSVDVQLWTAATLDDGMALLIKHRPKVVIVDRVIGQDDGRSILRSLAEFYPGTKVIVLTGHPGISHDPLYPPDAYLMKPVSAKLLTAKVCQLMT